MAAPSGLSIANVIRGRPLEPARGDYVVGDGVESRLEAHVLYLGERL